MSASGGDFGWHVLQGYAFGSFLAAAIKDGVGDGETSRLCDSPHCRASIYTCQVCSLVCFTALRVSRFVFNGVKEGLMRPVGERVETFHIAGLCLDGLFRLTGWSLG